MKDKIKGGLADHKKPSDFNPKALAKGMRVEREHTDSKQVMKEIAMDHLTEDPNYYDKLETIEKKAFWVGFEKQAGLISAIGRASVAIPRMMRSVQSAGQKAGKGIARAGGSVEEAVNKAGVGAYGKLTGVAQKAKELPGKAKSHIVSEFQKGQLQQRMKDVPERALATIPGQHAVSAAATRAERKAALKASKTTVQTPSVISLGHSQASTPASAPSQSATPSKGVPWGKVGLGVAGGAGLGGVGYGIGRMRSKKHEEAPEQKPKPEAKKVKK